MIQQALRTAAGSLEDLAEEVGVTYASLKAWADDRRNPSPENLARLADALERRGGELTKLAAELRGAE
jgi:transcriptional regulator with XRE-family HTH domain